LATAAVAECEGSVDADDLPFRLVESVISRRSDEGTCPPETPWAIADGALGILGWSGDFAALRARTAQRLDLPRPEVTVTG